MNKFCQECGASLQPTDTICTDCGNRLEVLAQPTVAKEKKPMSKMKKVISIGAAFLLVVLIGFSAFGNSYASAESTIQRFHNAVFDKDKAALKKMMAYEGGTELSDGELEAVIAFGEKEPTKFVKSIGIVGQASDQFLFSLKQMDKVLVVFKGYKVIIPNQYLLVPLSYEEISYTLNGEKVDVTVDDGQTTIGPVAPGIYELKAVYEGEYATAMQTLEVELLEQYSDMVYKHIEFEISPVSFRLENMNRVDPANSHVLIEDKKIQFDKDGYIRDAGPFVLDGQTTVKVVSEFPWGSFESEEFKIVENHVVLGVNGLNEEVEKDIMDTIMIYGEQSAAGRVAVNSENMNAATDEWKEMMQEDFEDKQRYKGYYTAQFDELQVAIEEAYVLASEGKYTVTVPVSFLYQSSYDTTGVSLELSENLQSCSIEVKYSSDEWKVDRCISDWWSREVGGVTMAASKTLHKPVVSKENVEE